MAGEREDLRLGGDESSRLLFEEAKDGLFVSSVWPVPTGSAIVLASSVLFYLTLLLRSWVGR